MADVFDQIHDEQKAAPSSGKDVFDQIHDESQPKSSFTDNLVKSAGDAASSFLNAASHPIDTLKNLGGVLSAATTGTGMIRAVHGDNPAATALHDHFTSRYGSLEQAKKTAYEDPVGFALDAAQVVGPVADIAGAALPARLASIKTPALAAHLDASEAAAVDWMKANNIPVDAATATGNPVVRNVQSLLAHTIGTADKAKQFMTEQKGALQTAGENLAGKVAPAATPETAGADIQKAIATADVSDKSALQAHGSKLADSVKPQPATPESAGVATRKSLDTQAKAAGSEADSAYSKLRQIEDEAQPMNVKYGQAPPKVVAPVDIAPAQIALRPIEKELSQTLTPANQQFSKGLAAIRSIINSPTTLPASVADRTLGGLKAIMREDVPAQTKFLVGKIIDNLSPQVDAAVGKLGPDATDALQAGRAATKSKYGIQDTLESLHEEPVRAFNQLTQGQDVNINQLRDVAAKAPDSIPHVARAFVDGLREKIASGNESGALADWVKTGPSTKEILFQDPNIAKGIASLVTKAAADNPLAKLSAGEPVSMYSKLTQAKDANVNLLRDVAAKAPSTIPALGRSVIDGLIEKAYGEVETAKPGSALTEWNKLGPSTKSILFKDPKLIGDLDNFFAASKMVAKNPNPSGSGFIAGLTADGTLAITAPHVAIPYIIGRSALGRMLYSPGGAKLLTEGMRIPVGNAAANSIVAGRILRLAGNDAKPMSSAQ